MAKYCANCGRLLPEGVEVCPDCHVEGVEHEAAPFTKITAETEVWRADGAAREKKKRPQSWTKTVLYAVAAVVVVILAVFVIHALQPRNRVIRAIGQGEYDRALEIFWSDETLHEGDGDLDVQLAALRYAGEVLERYKAREIDADTAAAALAKLGTFGARSEAMLEDTYAEFRALLASREHFEAGERRFAAGDYLAAREEYLLVREDDPDYAKAQTFAADCVDAYTDDVLAGANVLIQAGDYAAAIDALEAGDRALLALTLYSEKLDYKLKACYELYEADVLDAAERLAELGDYASAAALLEQGMERYDFETEALSAAVEDYRLRARDKALAEAAERADELYRRGEYAAAFETLEAMADAPDTDADALAAELAALEHRFSNDRYYEAKVVFNDTRANLPEALAILTEAIHIRATDELAGYKDELSQYLPASIADMRYVEKEGTIFRSASTFEGLDGVEYTGGWVWGEDGASVTFRLDGAYDRLAGTFAVRREENVRAGGWFELWCDGEQVYKSDTLYHWETVPIQVDADISGCGELIIRFHNDYNISTSENGYCYHGLCDAVVTKNIPVRDVP